MRSLSFFALILASMTLAASAQEYKTPKSKPYHSESKEKQSKAVAVDKKVTTRTANSQELSRLEKETAKTPVSNKTAKQRAQSARVAKAQHEKSNPPIHFTSATGTKGSMNNQGKNPYKGRVRQKGSGSSH